jgi:hypothetical protein
MPKKYRIIGSGVGDDLSNVRKLRMKAFFFSGPICFQRPWLVLFARLSNARGKIIDSAFS